MKNINNIIIGIVLITSLILSNDDGQISNDSLAVLIEEARSQILDEVIYNDPLKDKTIGLMFNPMAFLLNTNRLTLVGGISYFPKNKDLESWIGYRYQNNSDNNNYTLEIDLLNRFYFDRKYRRGFHLLYGGRFSSYQRNFDKATALGISFGIGHRVFNKKGFYWGTSLSLGRNFVISDDNDIIFLIYPNIELFKIGYLVK